LSIATCHGVTTLALGMRGTKPQCDIQPIFRGRLSKYCYA